MRGPLGTVLPGLQRCLIRLSQRPLALNFAKGHGCAVSVVMVTRNRATYLDFSLARLERQTFPRDLWQVVVIDNASCDNTEEILDKYGRRNLLPMKHVRLARGGSVGRARNAALEIAKGHVIIFLDDDRLVAPNFVLNHLRCHLKGTPVVLGNSQRFIHTHIFAPSAPALEGTSPQPGFCAGAHDLINEWGWLTFDISATAPEGMIGTHAVRLPTWAAFDSGNASVKTAPLLDVGGFDERFRGWGFEDKDLGYRLHLVGLRFERRQEIIALHQVHPSPPRSAAEVNRASSLFFQKHPLLQEGAAIQREEVTPIA